MKTPSNAIVAGVAGVALAVLLTQITGLLAAVQSPAWLASLYMQTRGTASLLSTLLLFALPVGLLAFGFGIVLLRLLRSSRALVLVSCFVGWLIVVLFLQLLPYSSSPSEATSHMVALLSRQSYWLSMLPVPAGLWLASYPGGANPSFKRTRLRRSA